ncbi:gp436 family protein [Salmonella enterica]|uniref:gp436 family protein n=1 Tax=Salmonella enterica TaxID=28901 RepID=UPI0009AD1A80|nr:phage protein Gp36 family protein [Salmonella enterica]
MMYASAQDMRDRYDNLDTLLFQPGSDTPNEKKLTQALNDAGALADSYLSAKYALPLAVVPKVLVQHCCAIAFYYLCDQQATDQARDRYREALTWLREVKSGSIPVGVDEAGSAPASDDLPQMQAEAPVFGRNQKGFI